VGTSFSALLGLSPDPDEDGQLKTTWEQMKTSLETNNETFAWMDKVEGDIAEEPQESRNHLSRSRWPILSVIAGTPNYLW
jgi:hypothetical protein